MLSIVTEAKEKSTLKELSRISVIKNFVLNKSSDFHLHVKIECVS